MFDQNTALYWVSVIMGLMVGLTGLAAGLIVAGFVLQSLVAIIARAVGK